MNIHNKLQSLGKIEIKQVSPHLIRKKISCVVCGTFHNKVFAIDCCNIKQEYNEITGFIEMYEKVFLDDETGTTYDLTHYVGEDLSLWVDGDIFEIDVDFDPLITLQQLKLYLTFS